MRGMAGRALASMFTDDHLQWGGAEVENLEGVPRNHSHRY